MLDRPWLDVVAVTGLVLAVLALAYAFVAQARVRGLRRAVVELGRTPALHDARTALQRVAVVRYDAFPESGGRLSWSAAVLDGAGTGLVVTTITGRSDSRSYAKQVTAGSGVDPLSPEELEAVARALRAPIRSEDGAGVDNLPG